MDDETVTIEEPSPAAQVPVLVAAPTFRVSRAMIVRSDPFGDATESIHSLRNHLVARHINGGRRALLICETDQAGGAFVAVNLAMSLAKSGVKTLLVDANFRGPQLESFIQPTESLDGLAETIGNPERPIGGAIVELMHNLSLAYAGDGREIAQELLGSRRLAEFFDLAMRDFEQTVVIAPPANFYSDARRLAAILRYVMIVVRRDITFVNDLKSMISEFASDGARVIGTVYNDF